MRGLPPANPPASCVPPLSAGIEISDAVDPVGRQGTEAVAPGKDAHPTRAQSSPVAALMKRSSRPARGKKLMVVVRGVRAVQARGLHSDAPTSTSCHRRRLSTIPVLSISQESDTVGPREGRIVVERCRCATELAARPAGQQERESVLTASFFGDGTKCLILVIGRACWLAVRWIGGAGPLVRAAHASTASSILSP